MQGVKEINKKALEYAKIRNGKYGDTEELIEIDVPDCQFCGGKSVLTNSYNEGEVKEDNFFIHCTVCGTETTSSTDKDECMSDWTSRKQPHEKFKNANAAVKHCPLCGGINFTIKVIDGEDCFGLCEYCGIETGYYNSPQEVIENWNRRVE